VFTSALYDQQSSVATALPTWREEAIAAARREATTAALTLRAELASRVRALTGSPVAPDSVYADSDACIATVTVDGTTFRLAQGTLVLLRPCVDCGTGQFASPPIASVADLGRALDGWQPFHDDCRSEDPADWLYRDDK
jgi:hypothetical protein